MRLLPKKPHKEPAQDTGPASKFELATADLPLADPRCPPSLALSKDAAPTQIPGRVDPRLVAGSAVPLSSPEREGFSYVYNTNEQNYFHDPSGDLECWDVPCMCALSPLCLPPHPPVPSLAPAFSRLDPVLSDPLLAADGGGA